MKLIKTLIFSFIFFLFSCDMQTVVDLEIPTHVPVLVLNGLLSSDTNAQVVVSHSVGAFSNLTPNYIDDAKVQIYKNNELQDSLFMDISNDVYVYFSPSDNSIDSLQMYYYTSTYIPDEKGANYRIEVKHPDYNSISAETYIPADISLYNINADTSSIPGKIGLTFSFDDDSDIQNYYALRLFSSCTKQWIDEYGYNQEFGFRGDTDFMSNDPSFPSEIPFDGYTFQGDNVVFTDALFNGQKKTIRLDVESELSYADCDTVIIKFSTFSNDTYLYYNSLEEHSDKGELGLFGGEVIPVYSNVENGLGTLISTNFQEIILKP